MHKRRCFFISEKIFNLTKPIFYDGSKPLLQKFTTEMNHQSSGPNETIVTNFITRKGQSFRGYAKSASFGRGKIVIKVKLFKLFIAYLHKKSSFYLDVRSENLGYLCGWTNIIFKI